MINGGNVEQSAYIELYSGWATTQRGGYLYGRVHKGKPLPLPEESDGLAKKLHETILDLDSRVLAGAQVRLSGFPGAGLFTADDHGFLKVPLPDGMPPGTLCTKVQLEMPAYPAVSATATLHVWGATNPALGVISDIDDTLTDTGVTHKLKMLKNTFFENSYDVKIFADAPQAVVAIAAKNASLFPVFYLSGSPWQLHERISQAFDLHGFPRGAMILRRYSQESLDPFDFKHPHLLEIVDANPGYKWILFGDTGEKDPEVYHTLIEERPGAVDTVFIHNVTKADRRDARFAGFTVFTDWNKVVDSIKQRNLGSSG